MSNVIKFERQDCKVKKLRAEVKRIEESMEKSAQVSIVRAAAEKEDFMFRAKCTYEVIKLIEKITDITGDSTDKDEFLKGTLVLHRSL